MFAPTNAAFGKLPAGTVEELLKPENKAKLVAILTYHVVPAKVMAADVKTGNAPSVNGKELMVKSDMKGVSVNGAKVVAADLVGSNGVVLVVDRVILPFASGLWESMKSCGRSPGPPGIAACRRKGSCWSRKGRRR